VADELDLLKRLGSEQANPDDESVERARSLLDRQIERVDRESAPPAFRRRRAVVIAATCLIVGGGLGFALASFVTPSGTASSKLVGFGFIPARGWNVLQGGRFDNRGAARAIAANVPIEESGESDGPPLATLTSLPARGVVIFTTFSPRGDPSVDSAFPVRSLPFRLEDAQVVEPAREPLVPARLTRYRIGAATAGFNVDVRVYFGAGQPSAQRLAEAQRQLDRLVVAAAGITLVVQPTLIRDSSQRLTIYGSVASGKAGESVTVQFKGCGFYPSFRDAFETTTTAGGSFTFAQLQPFNRGPGVFRAVSGDAVSTETAIRQLADVHLRYPRNGRTVASVSAFASFWHKRVLLQRYDRKLGVWKTMRRLLLTEQGGGTTGPGIPDYPRPAGYATEPFRPGVPKGTQVRVAVPLSVARPCYLAGVSETRQF
jgi:hypothetical protein